MICLSKADDKSVRHLSFNQSPSPLSASNTTYQDLNGMSNLREYVDAGVENSGGGGTQLGETALDEKLRREMHSPGLQDPEDAGRWLNGPSSHRKLAAGGEDQRRRQVVSRAAQILSWVTWLVSVLIASFILSSFKFPWNSNSSRAASSNLEQPAAPAPSRKRSTCGSNGVNEADYNMPLHVAALFIILTVSFLGCAFPILASKVPGLRIPGRFFFIVRHFGTGVLIATAFVHLLPTAFVSLGDPCLGGFWVNDYPPMPGAIALGAVFLVAVIEMVFHPSRHVPPAQIVAPRGQGCMSNIECVGSTSSGVLHPVRDMGPLAGRTSSMSQGLSQLNKQNVTEAQATEEEQNKSSADDDSGDESSVLSPEQKKRKDRLQCILLEMGILFHSVFIGMALSVSIGNEFIILLIAIIFHQTFEGLALGSRIASVEWEKDTIQPWLMALAYGCTTPLGQAIGLATHTLYSPDSEVGLILVGVMNAISAGLLTFASLVELLSEDFLSDASWRYLRGKERISACLLVFFGAFGMSLVGAWA